MFEIAPGLGTPLTIDEATQKRCFGMYARVLMDVDLSEKLFESVLVETDGLILPITVEYKRHPPLCVHCRMLGHTLQHCLKINQECPSKIPQKIQQEKVSTMMKAPATLPIQRSTVPKKTHPAQVVTKPISTNLINHVT